MCPSFLFLASMHEYFLLIVVVFWEDGRHDMGSTTDRRCAKCWIGSIHLGSSPMIQALPLNFN